MKLNRLPGRHIAKAMSKLIRQRSNLAKLGRIELPSRNPSPQHEITILFRFLLVHAVPLETHEVVRFDCLVPLFYVTREILNHIQAIFGYFDLLFLGFSRGKISWRGKIYRHKFKIPKDGVFTRLPVSYIFLPTQPSRPQLGRLIRSESLSHRSLPS